MVKRHLPSVEALTSEDEALLTEELRLSTICAHADVARAFLDEVDRRICGRIDERPSRPERPAEAEHAAH